MKKINTDLRRKVAPAATDVDKKEYKRIAGLPNFTGNLPLGTGSVISSKSVLTEAEKRMLKAAGWEEGQPVPVDLSKTVTDAQEEIMRESTELKPDASLYTLKTPKEVPFESLSEDRQAEIIRSLKEAKESLGTGRVSIPKEPMVEVTDSRRKAVLKDQPTFGDLMTITRKEATPENTEVKPAPVEESMTAGAATTKETNCSHCNWPHGKEDVVATSDDKYQFLIATLGQNRFAKQYKLFDGKLFVTFRTMTSEESDLVYRQLAVDMKKGRIDGGAEYYFKLVTYRLACSLERIDSAETGPLVLPPVSEYKTDSDNNLFNLDEDTKMLEVTTTVLSQAVPQESLRKVIANCFARFGRLVEHLEARVDDEGFWTATEGQP
jgi:hypothetical protein